MYSTSSFYVSSIFKILFILIIDSFPLNYWITNQFITFQILCMHIYRTDLMIFISIILNIAVSFAISLESEQSVHPIEFTSRIMPDMGSFTGDKIKLEEVILNLLRNAKDAVMEQSYRKIRLTADRIDDRIVIRCKDNGCGIPEDLQKTIFEPFITHKPGGTGLGLAVSKRIIEAHKGTLSFESKKGPGTTFTVSLPI